MDDYHRMAEAGILHEDDRVELIRGDIVQMAPIGPRHAACVARLSEHFIRRLPGRAVLWPQNPVVIAADSEAQPDVVLLHFRDDYYRTRLPGPDDVALLIEVADATLRYDRTLKAPLYAETGIAEYWIVDLEHETVEIYRGPGSRGYAERQRVGRHGGVTPRAFPDVTLAVTEMLG